MTDAEILDRLQKYFQNQINNIDATEMAEGPFEDGTMAGDLWEQAATRIDARGGLRIRFEFDDESTADRIANLLVFLEKGAQMLVDRVGQVDEVLARLRDEQATRLSLGDAAQQREERAVAEARPHDDEHAIGDVIKCQQCGQQTRSISRGCSVCGLGMARLDEPGKDAGHVWMPYPDEPGRRCACSIGHDHDEDPSDGPSQAQEVRAAADWPAEPVGDRYDELAADRHAELVEAERSEEVHGG